LGKSPAHVAVALPPKEALVASLELRNKTYRAVFLYAGKKYAYSLNTGDPQMAEALRGGVEKTLKLLSQGILQLPAEADLIVFVKAGGKVEESPAPIPQRLNLKKLVDGGVRFLPARQWSRTAHRSADDPDPQRKTLA
jgi:hypothetical protein